VLQGRDLIVLSDDWGRHPFSCQHIVKRFLPENRVLWVNTVGYRTITLSPYDLERAWEKTRAWFKRPQSIPGDGDAVAPGPCVINPFCLPFGRLAAVRAMNAGAVAHAIRSAAARLAYRSPVLITTLPTAAEMVGACGERVSIYYCVDDFTRWPGMDGRLLCDLEAKLLAKVDLVVAASTKLQQTRSNGRRPTRLLTHGVDVEHFASVGRVPPALAVADIRGPVVGYFGLVDERCDLGLIAELARRLGDVTFLLIGPWRVRPDPVSALENVRIVGGVPYDELPAYLAPVSVLLLPYLRDELAESLNPLKLKEYLATGLPVVATDLPEVRALSRFVTIVNEPGECAEAIRRALSGSRPAAPELKEFLAGESWDAKAEQFAAAITEVEGELSSTQVGRGDAVP
jgi:glycosyltransferase involved in cell wall biosynthesis